jgi:histone-lysine N-methyltransferase SETMAR
LGSQKCKGQMQMWTEYEPWCPQIEGQTVNKECYLEVLARLRESVRRKRPGLWPDKWILHHDNAPAHDALRFHEFLAKNSITKMDHPPYSPDLAPCDF